MLSEMSCLEQSRFIKNTSRINNYQYHCIHYIIWALVFLSCLLHPSSSGGVQAEKKYLASYEHLWL